MDGFASRLSLEKRWLFLKTLPNKVVRDIGFVVAGPSLLLDSDELPVVGSNLLGGGQRTWQQMEKWLQGLDAAKVEHWFESKKHNHRLGDHFAKCVEYILCFSPAIKLERLFYSQQVLKHTKENSLAWWGSSQGHDEALPLLHEDRLWFFKVQDGLQSSAQKPSEMQGCFRNAIQVVENDLSIKEESSKFDFQVLSTSCCVSDLGVAKQVPETKFKDGDGAHDIFAKQTKYEEEPLVKRTGKRAKKKLQKQERQMHGKGIMNTVGEFDFLFELRMQDAFENLDFVNYVDPIYPKTDRQSADPSCGAPTTNPIAAVVHHWEVSVKFLLYVGPWEAFGLCTPDHAWWSMKNSKHLKCSNGDVENFNISRLRSGRHTLWKEEEFLGCFFGPHAGETLRDRKDRLKKQIFLSSDPSAASVLFKLFGNGSLVSSGSESMRLNSNFQQTESQDCKKFRNLDQAKIEEQFEGDSGHQNKVLKVLPRAFLRGYLFYECQLWHFLSTHCRGFGQKDFEECEMPDVQCQEKEKETHTFNDSVWSSGLFCNKKDNLAYTLDVNNYSEHIHVLNQNSLAGLSMKDVNAKACLNSEQWIGWWIHVGEFSRFATLPIHRRSLWYIVPKHEWLSPVVITACEDGCEALLTLENFLAMAEKVAREAMEKDLPRKRRFMVAEVCWKPETVLENMDASRKLDVMKSGQWLEVSRGFVVEDTWPDSKSYAPHGFVASWSPNLENLHP